jgi:hypothetical protein
MQPIPNRPDTIDFDTRATGIRFPMVSVKDIPIFFSEYSQSVKRASTSGQTHQSLNQLTYAWGLPKKMLASNDIRN